jgi:pimeloyl-ACP methyl ester carboxylesterase
MRDLTITLPGGRIVAVADYGEADAPAIVYCHGAPTSRLDLVGVEPALVEAGVRAVGIDRPGYGQSAADPGRSIASWTSDAIAVVDELGIERFASLGLSSGGPYAVALAALHPDRVAAGATVGGVTDMAWPDAWNDYLPIEVELMQHDDRDVAMARCIEMIGADGSGMMEHVGELPAPDAALFEDEVIAGALMASMIESFAHGIAGYVDDLVAQGAPWPFDPAGIAVPFFVHHGELDTLVPRAHSEHTAELIPGAELRIWPGHGHLSPVMDIEAMVGSLRAALK